MTDYLPVDCRVHDELELAILHRTALHLDWKDADGTARQAEVIPVKLLTRLHEEFLVVELEHRHLEIRLDRIRRYAPAGHPA